MGGEGEAERGVERWRGERGEEVARVRDMSVVQSGKTGENQSSW